MFELPYKGVRQARRALHITQQIHDRQRAHLTNNASIVLDGDLVRIFTTYILYGWFDRGIEYTVTKYHYDGRVSVAVKTTTWRPVTIASFIRGWQRDKTVRFVTAYVSGVFMGRWVRRKDYGRDAASLEDIERKRSGD